MTEQRVASPSAQRVNCECGGTYYLDDQKDVEVHAREHDFWLHGAPAGAMREECSHDVVKVVGPCAPAPERHTFQIAGRIANYDLRAMNGVYCAEDAESNWKHRVNGVLAVRQERIIGLAVLDWQRVTGRRYADGRFERRKYPRSDWTFSYLWVARALRRQGVAQLIVSAGAEHVGRALQSIAFYYPLSADGEAFVNTVCPESHLVAGGPCARYWTD